MKIGAILNTNDAETCWNCFRFGNEALAKKHSVKIFLLGKGVEIENVKDAKFPLLEGSIKMSEFSIQSVTGCMFLCINFRKIPSMLKSSKIKT